MMAACPNCTHDLSRHMEGRECTARGCSCIIDPKGGAAFQHETSAGPSLGTVGVRRSRWDFILERPFSVVAIASLIPLPFVAVLLVFQYTANRMGWATAHPRFDALLGRVKDVLLVLSLPGAVVLRFWSPFSPPARKDERGVRPGFLLAAGLGLAVGIAALAAFGWYASSR